MNSYNVAIYALHRLFLEGGGPVIVATYTTDKATVHIDDSALQRLSPAQIEANRNRARAVAAGIARRAMERGELEGLTMEEWEKRYGHGGG